MFAANGAVFGGDVNIKGFGCFADNGMVNGGVLGEEGFGRLRCGEEYPHGFGGHLGW